MSENNPDSWPRSLGLIGLLGTLIALPVLAGTLVGLKVGESAGIRSIGGVTGFAAGLTAGATAAYRLVKGAF